MSKTYHLGCEECKVQLWVGQGDRCFYSGEPHTMEALRQFLWDHAGHELIFSEDDYFFTKEWTSIDADKYKVPKSPQKPKSKEAVMTEDIDKLLIKDYKLKEKYKPTPTTVSTATTSANDLATAKSKLDSSKKPVKKIIEFGTIKLATDTLPEGHFCRIEKKGLNEIIDRINEIDLDRDKLWEVVNHLQEESQLLAASSVNQQETITKIISFMSK